MTQDSVTLAIFDFDGTLTTGHLWVGIAKHHKTHRVKRLALYSYLMTHLPFWIGAKLKLYSEEKNRVRWGEDLSKLFKSFSREDVERAFVWVMDNYFSFYMRKDMLDILTEHKKKGHKIIILSGMLTSFLEVVGKKLGADYVIGTAMEINDGIYTGKIIHPLCFGENKARLLKKFVQEKGLSADFHRSYAYADSIYDLPVLQMVGNPVASYPDKELYTLARGSNWRIINHT